MASIQSIFSQFDLDKSGYIEIKELKLMAKKLGSTLSDKELEKLMVSIDMNQDGKISYSQFKQWWIKGHKGKLNYLIQLKNQTTKTLSFIESKFKSFGINLNEYKPTSSKDSFQVSLKFGEYLQSNLSQISELNLGCICGPSEYQKYKKQVNQENPFIEESTLSLTMILRSDQPKKLQKALSEIFTELTKILGLLMGIRIKQNQLESNEYFNIRLLPNQKQKFLLVYIEPGSMTKKLIHQIIKPKSEFIKTMGSQFSANVQISVSFKTSLKQILNGNKTISELLMDGCCFNFGTSLTSSAFKLFKKFIYKSNSKNQLLPLLLLKKLNFDIKVKTPRNLQEFFTKLGILEVVKQLPSLRQMIEIIATEIRTIKQQAKAGEIEGGAGYYQVFHKALSTFAQYVNPESSFTIQKQNFALYGTIDMAGFQDLFELLFPK